MIGTSATNSATTATVHSAAQNSALRPGVVKRLDPRGPGRAPTVVASPFATTALGAPRLITRSSSPASATKP